MAEGEEKRCSYRSKIFAHNSNRGFRCDGKDQCWVKNVGNFGTEQNPEYFCILHAPKGKEAIDNPEWEDDIGSQQSRLLSKLLDEWNEENKILQGTPLQFRLPGINCNDLNLNNYNFTGDINLSNSIFEDRVSFNGATFNGTVNLREAAFYENVLLIKAIFNKDVYFDGANFKKTSSL